MNRCILCVIALLLTAVLATAVFFIAKIERTGPVHPEQLARLIDRADKLVVRKDPWEESAVLFTSSNRRDLDALKASLKVNRPARHTHCKCYGTPAIFLYANGKQIGLVTNHHGRLLRCSLWRSDATIADAETFLSWFDDRKMPEPRKEFEGMVKSDKEWKEHKRKWVAAMPPALRPLWPFGIGPSDRDVSRLRKPLADQIPGKNERIRTLFTWFGSGAGPWSGYPSYETIAETLLLDYSTAELLAAIKGRDLTVPQTEGAARLFAGWSFSQLRPNDRQLLPAEIKTRLLDHSLKSTNEDKLSRARRAFAGK